MSPRFRDRPMTIAFMFVLSSWLIFCFSLLRAYWIAWNHAGSTDDVGDSLRLGEYIAQRMLPFDCGMLIFDAGAGISLIKAYGAGDVSFKALLAYLFWVMSTISHMILFLLHLI